MFRRALTLLLSVCLLLQGAGIAVASEQRCPMEAEMQTLALAGALDAADLPFCCNDMQTQNETGDLCKTQLDCQGLAAWAPAPAALEMQAPRSAHATPALHAAAPHTPPGTPWRPPTID